MNSIIYTPGAGLSIGTGLGRLPAHTERTLRESAIENFEARAKELGKAPGTHSLGKEFETPKKEK